MAVHTTHRRSHENVTHIYVSRQLGGDACRIYVCIFADLSSQRRQISEAEQIWIANVSEQLQKQLMDNDITNQPRTEALTQMKHRF